MLPLLLLMGAGAAFLLTRKSEESPAVLVSEPNLAPVPETTLELPPLPKAVMTQIPTLDMGLSPDERMAIHNAIIHETLPANLNGFASTFDPVFPVAASVLRAKAAELAQGSTVAGVEPCCDDCADGTKPCHQQVTGVPIFAGLPKSLGF